MVMKSVVRSAGIIKNQEYLDEIVIIMEQKLSILKGESNKNEEDRIIIINIIRKEVMATKLEMDGLSRDEWKKIRNEIFSDSRSLTQTARGGIIVKKY